MTPHAFDQQLELFYGGVTPNRATVYARLRDVPATPGMTLNGFIRGPHCLYSTTLPASIRLTDAGPGETLLARAMVPDPCYWSPELPFLYDVHIELKRDGQVLASVDRVFGMRNFGARGQFLYLNGKRWTVRGATYTTAPDLAAWHDAPLSMYCPTPPGDALCHDASRLGVLLVVQATNGPDATAELQRLARHAAVALLVHSSGQVDPTWQAAAPNIALASLLDADAVSNRPALDQPSIAFRPAQAASLEALRAASDQLQADLAPHGEFAGYIV